MWGETFGLAILVLGTIFGFLYLINKVSDLTRSLGLEKSIAKSLKQENDKLRSVNTTLRRELEELKNSQRSIEQTPNNANTNEQSSLKNYQQALSNLTEKLAFERSTAERLKQENDKLRSVNTTLRRELEELKNSQHSIAQTPNKAEVNEQSSLKNHLQTISDLTKKLDFEKSTAERLKQENDNLKIALSTLNIEKEELLEELKNSQHLIDQAADKAEADKWDKRRTEIIQAIARSAITSAELDLLYEGIENGRLINAFEDNLSIKELRITADIPSATQKGIIHHTSLTTCSCPDRTNNHFPCKHSLFLAYSLGVLQIYPTYIENKYVHTLDEYNLKIKEKLSIEEKIKKATKKQQALTQSNKRLEKSQNKFNQIIDRIITDRCSAYPHIAGIIADLETMHYKETAEYLENKQHPAKTEAKRIKELRTETKRIASERNELKYKLDYLKNLYPNIEDVFDDGFNEELVFDLETEETTDRTRLYLSHEEYSALSVAERNQLALDRYIENRKTKWQIGRDYEMYIGYTLEQKGFTVKYTGILENLEDMGRDLIVERNNVVQIVQCKNWSQEKTIHEKHIFQLYGSVILYQIDHPNLCVNGVFITTTKISDKAKKIASHLGIVVEENKPIGSFPRIKCNINRQTGEKIYHLPFDQQYDKTVIETKHSEFMAFTVKEAEEAGFRRAFKYFA